MLSVLLPILSLALGAAAAPPAQDGPPLAVYHYGDRPQDRDLLSRHGRMLDDLGHYVLGEWNAELSARLAVPAVVLPEIGAEELLAVVVAHPHLEPAAPPGRGLWISPSGHVELRALSAREVKEHAASGYRCHGAFRLVERGRAVQPASFSRPGGAGRAVTPKPSIQAMVGQVSQANLEDGVDDLVAFGTRRHGQPGEVNAQNWIKAELESLGLSTTLFNYDSGADVVIGELPGRKDPARLVIIGGHYDSINYAGSTAAAPGADDDASGVAAVLEIARVLSQHDFDYTIRFCAWSGEELGLLGSEAYAAHLDNINADVAGMVQLDMIAYRAAGDTRDVDFVLNDTDPGLNAFAQDVYRAYVPTLPVKSGSLLGGTSDHRSFHQHGFPATFPFEDVGQYSPYIHGYNDVVGVSANDFVLATLMTQGALATVAELARPLSMSLSHAPLPDTQSEAGPYPALLVAAPLAGQSVTGATVHYRVNGGAWRQLAMAPTGNPDEWRGDIPGQASPARVDYYLVAGDSLGNQAWLPEAFQAGEASYRFIVGVKQVAFSDDFELDRGWTHQQVATQDDWQRGAPQGKGGSSSGVSWSDPAAAYSGTSAWANDLGNSGWNGSYQPNVHNWLESPLIDCSSSTGTMLRFRRWLSVEENQYDQAEILVNGSLAWANPAAHLVDSSWVDFEVDVSAFADGNPAVRVRLVLRSDGGLELGGWALDDLEVYGIAPVGGTTNTITLTGSTSAVTGTTVSYSWSGAPAGAPWWLAWSLSAGGSTFAGHDFDLGPPTTIAATGTTSGAGAAAWTSPPLPAAAAGLTVYLEVASTSGGQWYDSNLLALTVS